MAVSAVMEGVLLAVANLLSKFRNLLPALETNTPFLKARV
jgi:hypothetical protein